MRVPPLVVAVLLLPAASLDAQQAYPPRAGDRVRVVSAHGSKTLVVREVEDSALVVAAADGSARTMRFPLDAIRGLEVSVGQRSRGGAFLRGLGLGGAAGFGVGFVTGFVFTEDDPPGWFAMSREGKALALGVVLGIPSALGGGIAGVVSPGEKWQRIALPERVGFAVGGQRGLALAWKLPL